MAKNTPKWLLVTDAIVEHFFEMMQNPLYRGPKYDAATFGIEDHVIGTGMMSFRRDPTNTVKEKMRERSRTRWKELNK